MELLISSFAPLDELEKSTQAINDYGLNFAGHRKSLTTQSRRNIRSVGSSRFGLVQIVNKLATQYDSKLSKEDKAVELSERIAYLDRIRRYKIAVLNLYEALDDTDKAIGGDIMAYVDKFSSSLQTARQHDGDLDAAMKELDDYNARFASSMTEEDEDNSLLDPAPAPTA